MNTFDVVVIGSGTGGQTAAYHLNSSGLKVAVIEKSDRPGGTCALYGCQPKKWFYEVTETVARSRHLQGKGIVAAPRAEWGVIRNQKNHFTSRIPETTVKGFEKADIEFISGSAKFTDSQTLDVDGKQVGANFFILATGASPMPLPVDGSNNIITSDDFLELETLPDNILFVGGGFISFEFAHFAARLGAEDSRLTIFEITDKLLGSFDSDMVDLLVKASKAEGIDVQTNIRIVSVEKQGAGFVTRTDSGDEFEADLLVHGAGRVANLEGLDLEAGGVKYSKKGIDVDDGMRTSNPQVFAVGDCMATPKLARVADYEAFIAAKNILAQLNSTDTFRIDYTSVPAILFTYPQYGMVGKTEDELKQEGVDYRKSVAQNLHWPTYQRVGLEHAAYKILVSTDGRILGAHILSDNASGLINTLKQAMIHGTTVEELYWQNIMSPYPTRESDIIYMLKPLLS